MDTWTATTVSQLQNIGNVLADAWFDSDRASLEPRRGVVAVPFAQTWEWSPLRDDAAWQDAPKTEVVRRTWRYTETRVPFMEGKLSIHSATDFQPDDGWGDAGMLAGLSYDVRNGFVRVHGRSGNADALVTTLNVRIDLSPTDIAAFARRRTGIFGSSERLYKRLSDEIS